MLDLALEGAEDVLDTVGLLGEEAPTDEQVREWFPALAVDAPAAARCGYCTEAASAAHLLEAHLVPALALQRGAATVGQRRVLRACAEACVLAGLRPCGAAAQAQLTEADCLAWRPIFARVKAAGGAPEASARTFAGKPSGEAQLLAAVDLFTRVLEHAAGPSALRAGLAGLRQPAGNAHLEESQVAVVLKKRGVVSLSVGTLAVFWVLVLIARGGAEHVARLSPQVRRWPPAPPNAKKRLERGTRTRQAQRCACGKPCCQGVARCSREATRLSLEQEQ